MKLLSSLAIGLSLVWLVLSQVPRQAVTSGLTAYDATGQNLPAWLEVRDERLLLQVDDTGAHYPVVVDPFVQAAKLTASDKATNARFGYSVAISSDTIVIGADLAYVNSNYGQGSVYVFVKPPGGWSGLLTQTAKLIASDGMVGDQLGWSVDISGDTIVAGALGDDHDTNLAPGSAYVFIKPSGGWSGTVTETAKLTATDSDRPILGDSVAIDGDVIAVGARSAGGQGAVYIFVKPPGGWITASTFTAKLISSTGSFSNLASISVALDGDTVVVGGATFIGPGSAYVFVKPSGGWSGVLTETAQLTVSNGATGNFGWSTGIDNDTVVVGTGTTYVFVKPNDGWNGTLTETAALTTADGVTLSDYGGVLVSINGDTIVAGATTADIGSNTDQGAIYVFAKPSSGWSGTLTQTMKLTATDGITKDYFGNSVAVGHNTIVVGAVGKDSFTGAAYVFNRGVDLSLTKSDGQISTTPGAPITYTIIVTNNGPEPVTGAIVNDPLPAKITGATWTCTALGSASCGTPGGTGSLSTAADLPGGDSVIFTITGTIAPSATGILTNTARVAVPPGYIDTAPNNNSATDTTTLTSPAGFPIYLPLIWH